MDEIDIDLQLLRWSELLAFGDDRKEEIVNTFIETQSREVLIAIIHFMLGAHDAKMAAISEMMRMLRELGDR